MAVQTEFFGREASRGGHALHGAPHSHGCIRLHPSTGQRFNALVRQYGTSNSWITVD